jgi:uncharacterized protein
VVQLLLEKGADIEAKNNNDRSTALHFAAEKGPKAVVRLLLKKGANIEAKDSNGRTALGLANWRVVKPLKQARPSLYQRLKLSLHRGQGG